MTLDPKKIKGAKFIKKLPKSSKPWQLTGYKNMVIAINPEHPPQLLTRNLLGQFKWEVLAHDKIDLHDEMLVNIQYQNRRRGLLSLCTPRVVDKRLTRK